MGKKISQLPAGITLGGSERVPVVQNGITVYVLAQFFRIPGTQQVFVDQAVVNVSATDELIILRNTISATVTVNLPAVASRLGPLSVVDWNGNASTVTFNPSGGQNIMGLSSWQMFSAGPNLGSKIRLDPVVSLNGYAITVG